MASSAHTVRLGPGKEHSSEQPTQQLCSWPWLFSKPFHGQPFQDPAPQGWQHAVLGVSPSLPQKSTPCSPSPPVWRLTKSQMLWWHFTSGQRPVAVETSHHGPCQGLGESLLASQGLGPEHPQQKQGLQAFCLSTTRQLFSLKGAVVGEALAAALSRAPDGAGCPRPEGPTARAKFPLPAAS